MVSSTVMISSRLCCKCLALFLEAKNLEFGHCLKVALSSFQTTRLLGKIGNLFEKSNIFTFSQNKRACE